MTRGMPSKIQQKLEDRLFSWKEKAVYRNQKIHSLQKQLKEVQQSRDKWKSKYKDSKDYQQSLIQNMGFVNKTERVKNHCYDLFMINLCLQIKQAGNLSLRSCQAVLLVIVNLFSLPLKVPCINTIRNWEHKQGYYRLGQQSDGQTKYALIVDESYFIGQQSLLLLLGVDLSNYHFESSLCFEDVELLGLGIGPAWTGDRIEEEIQKIQERNYELVYCCSDGANNISKALISRDLKRVPDCTHYLSKLVEREYKTTEVFQRFIQNYALTNRKNYMSKDSEICPPKLKGNSRFLNLYSFSKWATQNLSLVLSLSKLDRSEKQDRIYGKLKWLFDYKELVEQFELLTDLIESIFEIIKPNGLSPETINQVRQIINQESCPLFFRKGVEDYLDQASELLKEYEQVVCCSDIIESHFGKFKNKQRMNPEKAITMNCLSIANYGKTMESKELKEAFEKIRIIDLKKWQEQNKLKTRIAKKNELYKNVG